jgi:Phage integrase family
MIGDPPYPECRRADPTSSSDRARATVTRRLSTIAGFYNYAVEKVVTVPLAPRTARAIDLAIGERTEGPVFLAKDGRWLDRHGAGRVVRQMARRAGIAKTVTPDTLRHAFITAALDAGVPLRDVQEAASHADPRTTMRYAGRARGCLDRHAITSSPPTLPVPPGRQVSWTPPGGGNRRAELPTTLIPITIRWSHTAISART